MIGTELQEDEENKKMAKQGTSKALRLTLTRARKRTEMKPNEMWIVYRLLRKCIDYLLDKALKIKNSIPTNLDM